MTEDKQEPAEDDWESEGGAAQQRVEKSEREEFFSNQEQVSRPANQANGEKANKPRGSNSDPSI